VYDDVAEQVAGANRRWLGSRRESVLAQLFSLGVIHVMPPILIIWLARWASGERFRKAGPEELRRWAAIAAMMPLYFGAAIFSFKHAKHFWNTAGEFQLIIATSVVICVLFFGSKLWAQHIPAKISWILAAIGWALLFFLALTGRLV
jgi:hypothetical protein